MALVVATVGRSPDAGGQDAAADRSSAPSTGSSPVPRESHVRDSTDGLAAVAVPLMASLERRLSTGTAQQTAALAPPGDERAASWLRTLHHNVAVLDITALSLRYLGASPGGEGTAPAEVDDRRSRTADVAVRWRLDGFDEHASESVVRLVLRGDRRGAGLVGAGPGAAPLWLLDRVAVARTPRALVTTAAPGRPGRWSELAQQALRDVGRVLPEWKSRLVVVVPAGRRQLARVLGVPAAAYARTAAVATTAGRGDAGPAPVHVFVNRSALERLGARGSQVVLSHEATHVATRAPFSRAPAWLVEGFADYVALRGLHLPVRAAAAEALADVRAGGPPARLPGARDFAAGAERRGAVYEASWLACRLLGETYGERRLVAFYRESDRGSSTRTAFRTVLGTDEATFTRTWRRELRRLAG